MMQMYKWVHSVSSIQQSYQQTEASRFQLVFWEMPGFRFLVMGEDQQLDPQPLDTLNNCDNPRVPGGVWVSSFSPEPPTLFSDWISGYLIYSEMIP